jgi:predicted component of type VI protein secretion system
MIHNDTVSPTPENLWLEVRRGRTRAPRRVIRTRRFLIGAGSNCQLQLGGDDVPILHSILLVDDDGAQIDTVVPSPELFVNGVPQRSAQLRDGDLLTIGKFELAVHIQQPVDAGAVEESAGRPAAAAVSADTDLSHLSAAAIVQRLEHELREIAALQSGRETGATALLQTARSLGRAEGDGVSEHAVLLQLQELSNNLQQRVDQALGRGAKTDSRRHALSVTTGADEQPGLNIASHRKAS